VNLSFLYTNLFLFIVCTLAYSSLASFPLFIEESDARCKNGYHKSPSGDCEKVTDTKGMPRCPDGFHRSPDGDCERVSKGGGSNSYKNSKNDYDSNNYNNNYFDSTNTKNNDNKNSDKFNDPLNQIFSNNNNNNKEDNIEQSDGKTEDDNVNKNENIENIELEGKVTYIVDGDTLDINDIRIRLSLVDTPELGQHGYQEAKNFVKDLCLEKKGQLDIDDGQRRGDRYGRDIGIVYCDGINLNAALMENKLARIYTEYCDISEFSNEKWSKQYC
jgi:endonuclease YncB( thermonuclease family)